MFRNSMIALVLACAATAAAHAESKPGKVRAEPKDEMICKYEQATGSHIKKKTCATRAQREARAEEDQRRVRDINAAVKPNAGQ